MARMSMEEFRTWQALSQIVPFTDLQGRDYREGFNTALLYNVNRAKGVRARRTEDFMLRPPRRRKQSPEQIRDFMLQLVPKEQRDRYLEQQREEYQDESR